MSRKQERNAKALTEAALALSDALQPYGQPAPPVRVNAVRVEC